MTAKLKPSGIACELNLFEGSMKVSTTRKTWDPYAILKARDFIKLLSRGVPVQQASKIMEDDTHCDIIKIGNIIHNKDKFVKRRQRLLGPNGATLKAIEILTDCYVLVQGNTVAAMGSHKGLKVVRNIVLDCMKNVHPIYNIKTLMIKRELAKDPNLAKEDWSRFLPKFKKKNVKSKKPTVKKEKEKSLFPPEPLPRKEDIQMETGEYWMKESEKKRKQLKEKMDKQREKTEEKKKRREKDFVAPKEDKYIRMEKNVNEEDNIDATTKKIKANMEKRKRKTSTPDTVDDYIAGNKRRKQF